MLFPMSVRFKIFSKYLLFILVINAAILLGLEGLARLFISSPRKFFIESRDAQGKVRVQYRKGPLKPEFPKVKDPESLRIFAFGGSTVLGFPYYPYSSFAAMLALALQKSDPGRKIEMSNLGLSGMNSLEIKHCLLESLRYSPDLVIIYAGHNEFFQASLIPDWKYPRLDRLLEWFRAHSRLYQVLTRMDFFLPMIPSAIGTRQELTEKINLDFEQVPMESQPMSREYYQNRIQGYRYHLEQILSRLDQQKIPVLLCTVASNLKDWPPEWLPAPENVSAQEWKDLKQELLSADQDLGENKLDQAEPILARLKPVIPQYAMYNFLSGWLEEKRGNFTLARDYFLLARKYDNSRHRAPPEINAIIHELAARHRVALVDVEKLFFQNSKTTPGFDLFLDHVHPNLSGQRLIAQALFHGLAEQKMIRPAMPVPAFPSEDDFRKAFSLTDEILAEIHIRLATYYLLQRHLPEQDHQTIQLLQEIISRKPQDLFAGICLAAILLEDSRTEAGIQALNQTIQRAGGISQVQKTLERYFFPHLLVQGDYVLVHLNRDPTVAPLSGILLVRKAPEKTRSRSALPLDQYHWIFQYFPQTRELKEVTEPVRKLALAEQALCSAEKYKTLNMVNYISGNLKYLSANQAHLSGGINELKIDLFGPDPWLIIPIKLEPATVHSLKLRLAIKPENGLLNQSELNMYWSGSDPPVFSEQQKLSLPLKADGKFQELSIDLSRNINWLSSKKTMFLRLDPATFSGQARIREFKIQFCVPAGASTPSP